MAQISVITFKREFIEQFLTQVPAQLEHWGIYVEYEDNNNSIFLYHADKSNLFCPFTKFFPKEWSKDGGWLKKGRADKVDHLVLVGYSGKLTHEEMHKICTQLTANRFFNTLSNNCQSWVNTVLLELVNTGNLSELTLENFILENQISPLLGWSN